MQTRTICAAAALAAACVCAAATPASATLTLRCHWSAPTVFSTSRQVMMTPLVMDFVVLPGNVNEVAFVSFSNASDANRDGGGVLRIVDVNCNELAHFPSGSGTGPSGCPSNFMTHPHLSPTALVAGDLDGIPGIEIVGLLDDPNGSSNHFQLAAFSVAGTSIIPLWCSVPLPSTDPIIGSTAIAIAQIDLPGSVFGQQSEIIVDNKVFDANGILRFSGGAAGLHSRTVAVARVNGTLLPQLVTGRGVYRSSASPLWTGQLDWITPAFTTSAPALVYPAIAELDPAHPGPEIVVSDLWNTRLRVLTSTGVQLASIAIPTNPSPPTGFNTRCGGPPMVGNAHPAPGPEIGVASCTAYTLFSYAPAGPALNVLWSAPTQDPGGQTTSTLIDAPGGAEVVYADRSMLRVFQGATSTSTGTVLQSFAHSSATAIEGPVFVAMDTGTNGPPWRCKPARGFLVVGSNDYASSGGVHGLRIFNQSPVVIVSSCWNQHGFHVTNVVNSQGRIPSPEQPSWVLPAPNTYRVP